jgi:hypothetical protein
MADQQSVESSLLALQKRSSVHLVAMILWFAGTIFWAGAAYNRMLSMESHLEQIDKKLDSVSQIELIRTREDDIFRRLERLESR